MSPDTARKSRGGSSGDKGKESLWLAVRDVLIAAVAVAVVIGSVFIYSGTWPPMVVIESPSMQHSSDHSSLGVIDTGDLTLVKKVDSRNDIISYMAGKSRGYRTYENYGDVIIYAKNGLRELTPIIHRVITWIDFNQTIIVGNGPSARNVNTYNFPELGRLDVRSDTTSYDIGAIWEWDDGHPQGAEVNITIDFQALDRTMTASPHGGYITKGDHNRVIDQGTLPVGVAGHNDIVQPVLFAWVVGKAQGELPWFGSIKLWAGNAPCPQSCIPGNSKANLIIAIIVIAVGPFLLETAWGRYGDRVTDRIPKKWRDKWHAFWDKLPGGKGRALRRKERREERDEDRKRRGGRRHGGRAR